MGTTFGAVRSAVGVALLVGCGGDPDLAVADVPTVPEKPWVKVAMTEEAMARAAESRESMRFVLAAGQARVTAKVDGAPLVVTFPADLAAFRTANVHTLDYPIGYVRFDPLALDVGETGRNKRIIDTGFRRLGSPVQIFYDSRSIGAMVGRLASEGSEATGEVVGAVQIDDRQVEVALPARFRRSPGGRLDVTITGASLDLGEAGFTPRLEAIAAVLGARRIDPMVQLDVTLQLVRFDDDAAPLPTFVRTPVTVTSVAEVVEKVKSEAAADPTERVRARMMNAGLPEAMYGDLDDDQMKRLVQALDDIEKRKRGEPVGSVLDNPPPRGVPKAKSGTRVEGGVVIND